MKSSHSEIHDEGHGLREPVTYDTGTLPETLGVGMQGMRADDVDTARAPPYFFES